MWRKALSDEEAEALRRLVYGDELGLNDVADDGRKTDLELSVSSTSSRASTRSTISGRVQQILDSLLVDSHDIELHEKIGSGSFGDVFRGSFRDQPVGSSVKRLFTLTILT